MSDISETSVWLKFFTDAGIPPSEATGYAITFTDNRIKQAMLPDLNKEYLQDMDITAMGDIISILKHSKAVYGQMNRQKALSSSSTPTPAPSQGVSSASINKETASAPTTTVSKKSTAATRMLEHYVRKEPLPPPPPSPPPPSPPSTSCSSILSPSLSARLGGTKRAAEPEEEDPSPSSKRSSVFDRLGDNAVSSTTSDTPKITVTMLGKDKLKQNSEGSSNSLTRVCTEPSEKSESPKEERPFGKGLQYHGILKYSSKELAAQKSQESVWKIRTTFPTARPTDCSAASSVHNRIGVQNKPVSVSEGIFAQESSDLIKSKKKKVPKASTLLARDRSLDRDDLVGKSVIKKMVKVNKKTGQIVREESREVRSNVFKRLGD